MPDKFLINSDVTVKQAMLNMNNIGEKTLFVIDKNKKFRGSLTEGDIRRWILKSGDLNGTIEDIFNRNAISVGCDYSLDSVKKIMVNNRIEAIPVVGQGFEVVNVLIWEDVFGEKNNLQKNDIDIPVIIMAGGKGTRLDPFTRILPKPLIPIGDKAVIDIIMDKFIENGIRNFFLAINHKSKMIKSYFEEKSTKDNISYIEEDKPLGTIGSVKLVKDKIENSIMVSNCDIIVNCNYSEIIDFHKENSNDITIVGSFRHFVIPYGICDIKKGGILAEIKEKPEYDFLVNTGMSVLQKNILDLIPDDSSFDIIDLVKKVKEENGKVAVFPINEKSWIDVGQWEEYRKSVRLLGAD